MGLVGSSSYLPPPTSAPSFLFELPWKLKSSLRTEGQIVDPSPLETGSPPPLLTAFLLLRIQALPCTRHHGDGRSNKVLVLCLERGTLQGRRKLTYMCTNWYRYDEMA